MKKRTFLFPSILSLMFLFQSLNVNSQTLSATEILEKSIAYHDPQNNWPVFNGTFTVQMESPNRPLRHSVITLDRYHEYYKSIVTQNDTVIVSEWDQGNCSYQYNGSPNFNLAIAEKHRLNCEQTSRMRNYYAYLYGLPMKLKDPGTQLHPKVEQVVFYGEPFYRLRADYDENVGTDRWYFYFDMNSFQLRHYQFYHDEAQNDGEYILMEGEETIQGIKMPKIRSWYFNNDQRFLGTDTLLKE